MSFPKESSSFPGLTQPESEALESSLAMGMVPKVGPSTAHTNTTRMNMEPIVNLAGFHQ